MSSTEAGGQWVLGPQLAGWEPPPRPKFKALTPGAIGANLAKELFVELKNKTFHKCDSDDWLSETTAKIKGRGFSKNFKKSFFKADYLENVYPEIVCDCGCTAFQARYGDYQLLLKCLSCGAEDVVYDG